MEKPISKNPELNHLRKELLFSEVKFYTIAQTATDSIIIADQDSKILFLNKKAEEIFGYTEDEVIGKSLTTMMPEKYRKAHLAGMQRFINTDVPKLIGHTVELEGLKKSGAVFPIELSLSSWTEDDQYYFCGIIRDITERKSIQTGLELLSSITADINQSKDFYSALRVTITNVCKVLGWNVGEAWLGDEDKKHIFFAPVDYISDDNLLDFIKQSENMILEAGQGMPGRVYEGKTEWYPDITLQEGIVYRKEAAQKAGLKSGFGVPIKANGETIAALLFYRYEIHPPEAHIRKIVESICNQMGTVLRNKQAEEKLKESQFLIKQIADSSPTIISVYDRINKRTVYTNRELIFTLGYTPQQLLEMGEAAVGILVHPDDKVKLAEREKRLEKAGDDDVIESEIRIKAPNGEWKWLYSRTTIFKRTPEGKPWQTLSTSIEITSIKQTEEKLQESEQALRILNVNLEKIVEARTQQLKESEDRLRIAIESTELGTWDFNLVTQKILWNDRCKEMFGVGPDADITYEKFFQLIYPDDRGNFEKAVQLALNPKNQGPYYLEYRIVRQKDNIERWVRSNGRTFFDEKGNATRFIGTVLDITDSKRAMDNIIKANKELKKINADLDNFVYTASHDLKAPVSNIEGLINALCDTLREKKKIDKDINELIDMITTSIKRFQTTIRDLTDISKVQRNINEDIVQINISEGVQNVIANIHRLIEDNNATVNVNTDQCNTINFSKINFQSIVYNLLTNAIKYRSPERIPVVNIFCSKYKDYFVLEFQDNGLGIPKEYKDKIFEMFRRMHHHVEGTGVGLYLVKRIVENSNGKIELESEVDKGSVFRIYLRDKNRMGE